MYRGTDVGKGSESRSDLDQLFSNVRAWLTLFNIGVVLSFAMKSLEIWAPKIVIRAQALI